MAVLAESTVTQRQTAAQRAAAIAAGVDREKEALSKHAVIAAEAEGKSDEEVESEGKSGDAGPAAGAAGSDSGSGSGIGGEAEEEDAGDIAALNVRVQKILKAGKLEGPEIEAVRQGDVVYHERWVIGVYASMVLIAAGVALAPSVGALLAWGLFMYLYMDFYGGVLHVVLDNPRFIGMPLIGPGVLEFQWHHHIATDIVSKSFAEVCGDLNVAVVAHIVWVLGVWRYMLDMPMDWNTTVMMMALKIGMAYMGQFAHRNAHARPRDRHSAVKFLQRNHVLLAPQTHHVHHKVYDDSFPILSGHTNKLLTWMLRTFPSDYGWLAFFGAISVADIILFVNVHSWVAASA